MQNVEVIKVELNKFIEDFDITDVGQRHFIRTLAERIEESNEVDLEMLENHANNRGKDLYEIFDNEIYDVLLDTIKEIKKGLTTNKAKPKF